MAQGEYAVLPQNLRYIQIEKQEIYLPKQLQLIAQQMKEISSCSQDETNYIKLGFDMNGICQKVVYLGQKSINIPALTSCIGLSDKYLNKLP